MELQRVRLRWMIRRDMLAVLEIERLSFDHPWSADVFMRTLRCQNCIGMVAECDELVVGYAIYRLQRHSLEILNFAVHPDFRRQQVGTAILDKLKRKLSPQRRKRITLQVRETNLPAQLFFRACGMRATIVVKDAFEDSDEDAYIFRFSPHMEVVS